MRLARSDPAAYAWDLFVQVNLPASPTGRGEPSGTELSGKAGPVVWSTWKTVDEVFLLGGARPGKWESGDPLAPPRVNSMEIDGRRLRDRLGNFVLFETRMNRATFEYLVERRLYSFAGQQELLLPGAPPVDFPSDAMEVKASWRLLGPDEGERAMSRYFVRQVRVEGAADESLVMVALTGLHITSKVLPNWFWATFEHVDNAETTRTRLRLPIPPDVAAMNTNMQRRLAGTRWGNYRLNAYQVEPVDREGRPLLAANSQIETHFQESSSCLTCHALAAVGAPSQPRPEMFRLGPAGLKGPVGQPSERLFQAGNGGGFRSLDFVWSLRHAR